MTDKVKDLIKEINQHPEKVNKILHDPKYGRKSVADDFHTSKYVARQAIKHIKEDTPIDSEQEDNSSPDGQAEERAKDPIDAGDWEIPDEWVYDRNYVYNAEDDTYVFMTREFGNIVKNGTWVKNLVKAYSNWDGEQDTINEVCRKFGITRGLFNEIKSILGLTHDHEPFTPEEIRSKSSEEMAQEAYQMKRFRTKQKFDKKDWKATKKEAKKWRNLKHSILEEVKTEAPNIVVDPVEPDVQDVTVPEICLHTGDWHLGAVAKDLPSLPDFNPQVLKDYINLMVEAVRSDFPDSKLHIHYKGDVLETVTGMNHAGSWKNIAEGYYGAKPILEAEKYLLEFIKSSRASSFKGVTGNHGRITSNYRKDESGEAELIIYQHLKDRLEGVDVEYSEFKIYDVIDGIGYITFHGHHKSSKKVEQQVVQALRGKFDDPVDFVLVSQGHYHSRDVNIDKTEFRYITVPSLFTGMKYNERAGFGALAGFTVTYKHPLTGKIQVNDYSL